MGHSLLSGCGVLATHHSSRVCFSMTGCRGLRLGGAQMSEKHPNFLINTGAATAHDLEALGEEVRARVKSTSGHELTWEIQRIGVKLGSK